MTVVYAIDTQSMDLLKGTQSIRYCIILIGAFAFARYYISNKVFNDNLFIEKLVINVLTTSILVSFFNILMDLVTGDFKLRYTTSTVCFAAMIFYVALNKNYSFRIRLLLPVVSAMLLFPITRGEQLILAMTFMIYIYLSFGKNQNTSFKDYFSSKVTLVLSIVGLSIALNYVAIYLPDTWQMLAHKFSFFVSGDIKIDQSSSVRIEEYVAILRVDDWKSAFYLLFGKGWLGTFSFPTDFVSSLEQTDFALIDIYNNRFYSPHSFLGFHILKFGLIGSVLLFYLILNSVNLKNREINQSSELSLLLLPAIFYIGYFNPTFLFISMSILFSQVIVARGSSK
nr:hypothetical protein [uncultured Vibrio sp.]